MDIILASTPQQCTNQVQNHHFARQIGDTSREQKIADIKYPSEQRWSPDGKTIAFLWDAAGKQDLFMVKSGGTPIALTDFPVDPDLLVSDIGHFEWASPEEVIFSKGGQLWVVSTSSSKPIPLAGFQ